MSSMFEDLQRTLATDGPTAAIDRLIVLLRSSKDFAALFYALLMKKRHELGVTPIPTQPAQELPPGVHADYEEAIRQAGRTVGQLYLDDGDLPTAWNYFRLIGDAKPLKDVLDRYQPAEGEDVSPLIEIAFHHGVHPTKGFDLVLDRQGICSAITMVSSLESGLAPEVRTYCVRRLVAALYEQLTERLRIEIERHDGKAPPPSAALADLISSRPWLFGEDYYHVDISHLSSVVHLSLHLPPGDDGLTQARELCVYGARLSPKLQSPGEPPFEQLYRDAGIYLRVLAGVDVDAGIGHFRAKAKKIDLDRGTLPAEVYVNLLVYSGRTADAIRNARTYLTDADERQLSCPGPMELCRRSNDFTGFADVARVRGDAVHFLAGLLAGQSAAPKTPPATN